MRDYNLRPNKRLGQNFIIDRNIVDKIISSAGISGEDTVLEIGAGLGNVTADIAKRVNRVIAVEFDKGFCRVLRDTLREYKNCELVCGDILKVELKDYVQKNRVKVIGNIPFYITTPVLEYLIKNKSYIIGALLTVQKEVAERLMAQPKSRFYSSISCYIRFYARLEFKGIVKRTSFFPKPDVDSVLLYMKILDSPSVDVRDEKTLFEIIRTAFNQRRKTLLSSLSRRNVLGLDREKVEAILNKAGISSQRRPESLSLKEFARISNEFPG
ncbi:MAG: 16S rRNA (adenine(1518)-N(6)/adenine(1519)-N(6))-dimethyltransferase RsmA [Candidatus Omnitrophica bacterium]|nr:16S rRNA (adenine(1518)-N(6)/adenine(1519)-N(6))-dimethyltransferase RsmA [Candidatus Omnitrophota bacterium]